MALSKVDLANQVENQLPQNLVANNLPFRNIIINGDMSIAQRGTSSSGITSGGFYTVDRMKLNLDLGTWTQSQDSDVPTGQGFAKSFKMDCTTANASPSAALSAQIRYRMEGQMLQYLKKGTANAESLTLSFWVKSNKTGTYIAELVDNDNARQISKSYTISSADTWEKKTLTFAGDTTGAFDNDNAASADLFFWLGSGSDYTSGTLSTSWSSITQANRAVGQVNLGDSTSNYINITGVQLEAGTSASDFEFLPVDVNLQRCQRYFQSIGGVDGSGIANGMCQQPTASRLTLHYITTMRAAPTHSVNDLKISDSYSFALDVTSISATFANDSSSSFNVVNATGGTSGRPVVLSPKSTSSTSRLTLEAEL